MADESIAASIIALHQPKKAKTGAERSRAYRRRKRKKAKAGALPNESPSSEVLIPEGFSSADLALAEPPASCAAVCDEVAPVTEPFGNPVAGRCPRPGVRRYRHERMVLDVVPHVQMRQAHQRPLEIRHVRREALFNNIGPDRRSENVCFRAAVGG